jgi:hypothetical protein
MRIIAPFYGERGLPWSVCEALGFCFWCSRESNGVCKSRQLQCHKSGGNVHSWGLKDGVGIYLEEQVEATLRVSALQTSGDQPMKIMACDWVHKLKDKSYTNQVLVTRMFLPS